MLVTPDSSGANRWSSHRWREPFDYEVGASLLAVRSVMKTPIALLRARLSVIWLSLPRWGTLLKLAPIAGHVSEIQWAKDG